MALIVQKFGGSSVADRDRIFNVARIVANTHAAGNDVVVVVSAQGDTTDDLIAKAGEITHDPSQREMDMLLATGEQICIALLAMAAGRAGLPGHQPDGLAGGLPTPTAPTRARASENAGHRAHRERAWQKPRRGGGGLPGPQPLRRHHHPGARRLRHQRRGHGGGAARGPVPDLHGRGRRLHRGPAAGAATRSKLDEITFDEMLELASLGAQVLNNRSRGAGEEIFGAIWRCCSSLTDLPGTIVKEVTDVEGMLIKGVAKDKNVARHFDVWSVPDVPGACVQGVQPAGAAEDQRGHYPAVAPARDGTQGRYFHRAPGRRRNSACAAGGTTASASAARRHCPGQGRGEGVALWARACRAIPAWRPRMFEALYEAQHQHPHDLHQRDQDLGADRRKADAGPCGERHPRRVPELKKECGKREKHSAAVDIGQRNGYNERQAFLRRRPGKACLLFSARPGNAA